MKKRTGIQKRWMFNNLSVVILLVAAVVVAFSLAFTMYYYSNMQSGLEAKAKTTTDFFGNYLGQSYNEYYQSCINFAHNFEDKNTLELQFISPSGRLVASSYGQWAGRGPGTSDVENAIETKRLAVFNGKNPETGERIMAVSSPMIYTNGEVIGVLRYVTSLKNVGRQILMLTAVTVLVGALFILLIMYNSRYFIRSIIEPVSEITDIAKRISAGSYGVQIKKKFDDEIGELTDTINEMSVKLGQAERMQSEFVSSVSHELRTPLTAISGWGETILSAETMDPVETRRGMVIILRETRRLTDMVEELLEFTRMQDGRFTLNMEPAELQSEFEDTVFMYGSRLKQEGIELTYLENDDVLPEIRCDVSRMKQVFLNILDNAVKHGGKGRKITAEIRREGMYAAVRIRDFGPGIPEDELPYVKMKFYKGSTKARGSGIGLAVCEEIVTMHGGQLILSNAEGGGTLVTIRLPIGEGA